MVFGYLTDTTGTQAERDRLFADLARLVASALRRQEKATMLPGPSGLPGAKGKR